MFIESAERVLDLQKYYERLFYISDSYIYACSISLGSLMYTQLPVDTAASSKILDAPPEVKNLSKLV